MRTLQYSEDVLQDSFEAATLVLPNDYEGAVVATLVRKKRSQSFGKAILYLHGFNDYFFHSEMANRFVLEGYDFYALDLRKYGRSILPHQKPNNVRSLREYFPEIQMALEHLKTEGAQKIVLFGHSTGGLIATLFAAEYPISSVNALLCNSPFLDMNMKTWQKKILVPSVAKVGRWFPNIPIAAGFTDLYGKSLHQDAKGLWQYNLLWKPHKAVGINSGWVHAIHSGHLQVQKGIVVPIPTLVLHAQDSYFAATWHSAILESDAILNVSDIARIAATIKSPSLKIQSIPGAIHDVMLSQKVAREIAFQSVLEWLDTLFDKKSSS